MQAQAEDQGGYVQGEERLCALFYSISASSIISFDMVQRLARTVNITLASANSIAELAGVISPASEATSPLMYHVGFSTSLPCLSRLLLLLERQW